MEKEIKIKTILTIEMIKCDNGKIRYNLDCTDPNSKETSSTGYFDTITKTLVYSLYET